MRLFKNYLPIILAIIWGCAGWGMNNFAFSADSTFTIENFPTQVGNSWEYRRTFTSFFYDTLYADTSVDIIIDSLHTEFQAIDTLHTWECYRYNLILYQAKDTFSAVEWYAHPDTAFLKIAYYGTSVGPPGKGTGKTRLKLGEKYFNTLDELKRYLFEIRNFPILGFVPDTGFWDPPKKLFIFPLSAGRSWVAMTNPWLEEREVTEENFTDVPGGSFHTLKVAIKPDIKDIEWYQWIAERGIAKDSLYVKGIVATGYFGDTMGYIDVSDKYELLDYKTDVNEWVKNLTPKDFSLGQNYPNPLNPITTIPFSLRVQGSTFKGPIPTTLKIYNILGKLVRTLVDEEKKAENYNIIWDGKDNSGKEVASGIYFYQLRTKDYTATKKMVLLR